MSDLKTRLQDIFKNTFEDPEFNADVVKRHFHSDYVQHVDGNTLNRDQLIDHLKAVKDAVSDVKITFKHLVAEGDTVCSIHIAQGTKDNGKLVKAQVHALFKFKDNQLILCDEITRLLEGDESDRDMGSRH